MFQLADRYGPLFAGPEQPVKHLLAVELFPPAIFFHHHVGDFVDALVRGEALTALQTLAAAADGVCLLGLAGIHDFVIDESAKRTLHALRASRNNLNRLDVTKQNCSRRDSPHSGRARQVIGLDRAGWRWNGSHSGGFFGAVGFFGKLAQRESFAMG